MTPRTVIHWLCAFTCAAVCLLSSRLWLEQQSYTAILRYNASDSPSFRQATLFMSGEYYKSREDIISIAVWAQGNTELLESEENTAQADMIYFRGNPTHVIPEGMIAGSMPEDSSDSVALDEYTAYELFGSVHVMGMPLKLSGRSYRISGVFSMPKGLAAWGIPGNPGLAVLNAPDDMKIQTAGLLLAPSLDETGSRAKIICSELGSPSHVEDIALKALFVKQFGWLPFWLCALNAITRLLKAIFGYIRRPSLLSKYDSTLKQRLIDIGRRIAVIVFGMALALGVLRLVDFSPAFPLSWLPTRWSDFSHWGRLVSSLGADWANAVALPVLRTELPSLVLLLEMILSGTLAIIIGSTKVAGHDLKHLTLAAILPLPSLAVAYILGFDLYFIPALVIFPAAMVFIRMLTNLFSLSSKTTFSKLPCSLSESEAGE